jgi:O-antigen/teichoic acid export membrane protein
MVCRGGVRRVAVGFGGLYDPVMSSASDRTESPTVREEAARVLPPRASYEVVTWASADHVERRGLQAAGQLVARTVLTQGVTLVGTIALARILTPASFGVYALITLVVTIITVVGDLGIGAGLVQQMEEPSAADLETVLAVQLALFGGLGLAAAIAGPALAVVLDLGPGSSELAILLAATILLVPLRGIPIAMLSRALRFGPIAASEVAQQLAFFGVAVGAAAMGAGVVSFGLAAIAEGLVATVIAWVAWGRRSPRPRLHRAIAVRLWRFGIGMQGAAIAAWAKDAVVPVFGGLAGGVSAIGYLQFAWRNGQMITAVDDIVMRVGFPGLSRLQHDPTRFARASGVGLETALLVTVGVQAWLIASASVLIPVIFSAQWTASVDAFRFVAAGAIAGTMTAVIRTILIAAGQSGAALRAGLGSLAVIVVALPAGLFVDGVTGGGIAFLASSIVGLAMHTWVARALVEIPWSGVLRVGIMGATTAALGAVILLWRADLVGLTVSGVACVTLFGALAIALERPLLRTLLAGLKPASASGSGG